MPDHLRQTRRELLEENQQLRAQLAAQSGPVLPREKVRAMSPDEINANWLEVQRAMAAGLPRGEQDD